jgi:hypothetical protein
MIINAQKAILPVAALAVIACLLLGPVGSGVAQSMRGGRADAGSIGPGKVRLSLTQAGAWEALRTVWDEDNSLIYGGGFVLYARGPGGVPVRMTNTERSDLSNGTRGQFRKCVEGDRGGFRAPSPRPDDDGDGHIDEDRLDGLDNDGDGRTDEDFAAIGDEMIVTGFNLTVGSGISVEFHQEMYGWSLPHIDGAVMIRLNIRNTGRVPLENLRVGLFYDRAGGFDVRRQSVPVADGIATEVVVTEGRGGTKLAVFPCPSDDPQVAWSSGYVANDGDRFESILVSLQRANAGDAHVEEDATVFCMSPRIDHLAVGAQGEVNLVLAVAPRNVDIAEVAGVAMRTYLGDGENRYLPPPVAVTPQVLWGHYRSLTGEEDALWVDFDVVGQRDVDPKSFSFFTGIDPADVAVREISAGQNVLVLRGELAQTIRSKKDRVVLKGRLDSGEFFEAVLRPYSDGAREAIHAQAAESFWTTPGRLTRHLVKGSPNPFRESTRISYEIPSSIEQDDGSILYFDGSYETSVKVYNVAGRLVSVLVDEYKGPGRYSINWAAIDDHGNPVASGVYYVKLQVEKRSVTERLILLK